MQATLGGVVMQHRIEAKVGPDGSIILHGLPFHEGETVEIVVKSSEKKKDEDKDYPLRGTPVIYERPFDPVAENDWSAAS